jgi:hypothetical protein
MSAEKICEIIDLKEKFDQKSRTLEQARREEDAARLAYGTAISDAIERGQIKVDQVYMMGGKAVIFRKELIDPDRSDSYRYFYEILPVT